MEVGIATEEGLTTVLRQIGQKRRQGVLELVSPERHVEILFVQGKIVEVLSQGEDVSKAALTRLKEAGIVPPQWVYDSQEGGEPQDQSYRALFLALVEAGVPLDEDLFRNTIKQCVLDRLYQIDLSGSARFQFRVEMVEYDREFSPTISIGQVLLDLVALPSNRERFEKLFPESAHLAVKRTEVPEGVLTAEEKLIYAALSEPLPVETLQKRVMLSRFYFWDGVLSLFERGLIATCSVDASAHSKDSPPLRELIQSVVVSGAEAETLIGAIADMATQPVEAIPAELSLRSEEPQQEERENSASAPQELVPSRIRSERWSLRVLESAAAVQVVGILYILACLTVPWFTWSHILEYFAQ
jgi:hypothetical protein